MWFALLLRFRTETDEDEEILAEFPQRIHRDHDLSSLVLITWTHNPKTQRLYSDAIKGWLGGLAQKEFGVSVNPIPTRLGQN